MAKAKKLSIFSMILLISILLTINAFAEKPNSLQLVRIAILDNFTAEKSSQKYKDAYFAGIFTAEAAAHKKGFSIQYKTFTYGNKPLDILSSIAEVQAWNPDLIIGPHSSNQFLLLPKYFKNVLVISPYATDEATIKMPSNFYSLSLPDSYMAKATVAFMEKYYPGRDVFNITQADCKDCFDMTEIFSSMYKSRYPNVKIGKSYYVSNKIQNLNIENLLSGYKQESIIVLQPLSYEDANLLIPLISNFLKQKNTIFIQNLDNWGNSSETRRITSNNIGYSSFRVCPLMEDTRTKIYKTFIRHYQNKFHSAPRNAVSYMSYASVMSAIDALDRMSPKKSLNTRVAVLSSYQVALKNDPNWYRPNSFIHYQLDYEGEKRHGIIFKI